MRRDLQTAVIISTHDIEWALKNSDYVLHLEKGKVRRFIPTRDLASLICDRISVSLVSPSPDDDIRNVEEKLPRSLSLGFQRSSRVL